MLTREDFLKPVTSPVVKVEIPELGGHVHVRGMSARERSVFDRQFTTSRGAPNLKRQAQLRERLCLATICDDKGNLLFKDSAIDVLGRQPIIVIERVVAVAQPMCGLGGDEKDEDERPHNETEKKTD